VEKKNQAKFRSKYFWSLWVKENYVLSKTLSKPSFKVPLNLQGPEKRAVLLDVKWLVLLTAVSVRRISEKYSPLWAWFMWASRAPAATGAVDIGSRVRTFPPPEAARIPEVQIKRRTRNSFGRGMGMRFRKRLIGGATTTFPTLDQRPPLSSSLLPSQVLTEYRLLYFRLGWAVQV